MACDSLHCVPSQVSSTLRSLLFKCSRWLSRLHDAHYFLFIEILRLSVLFLKQTHFLQDIGPHFNLCLLWQVFFFFLKALQPLGASAFVNILLIERVRWRFVFGLCLTVPVVLQLQVQLDVGYDSLSCIETLHVVPVNTKIFINEKESLKRFLQVAPHPPLNVQLHTSISIFGVPHFYLFLFIF